MISQGRQEPVMKMLREVQFDEVARAVSLCPGGPGERGNRSLLVGDEGTTGCRTAFSTNDEAGLLVTDQLSSASEGRQFLERVKHFQARASEIFVIASNNRQIVPAGGRGDITVFDRHRATAFF